jgi:hypothetical protein
MPAKSAKQERFMQAVAHNPKFAKAAGVPQSVGKEFTKSGGGMAKANPFMEMIAKKKAMAGKKPAKKMASGGLAAGHKSADGVASKGKTKAMMPKMAGNKGVNGMKKGGMC